MKFFKHLHTINKHRFLVIKICFKLGIGFQGLFHDLSKYSPSEFFTGVKYYQGNRSPNAIEREIYGYSKAWLHHKGRNKHHFEYWMDINPKTNIYEPCIMPLKYLKEMFADRIAACKTYEREKYTNSSPLNYFLKKESNIKMHPITLNALKSFMVMLEEKGEKETFKYIKNYKEEDYGKSSNSLSDM